MDVLIIIYNNKELILKINDHLATSFYIKNLEKKYYISSIQIITDQVSYTIYISEQKYFENIFKKFAIKDYKPLIIPLDSNRKLLRDINTHVHEVKAM